MSDQNNYSIADLDAARADLAKLQAAWENYDGGNPDKYQSRLKSAQSLVVIIESSLKSQGVIPYTPQELLERELDKMFPDAKSKDIVEYEGKRYQRWYRPLHRSNSGKTVKVWDRGWEEVK